MQKDNLKHDTPTDANNVLAEVFLRPKTRGELYDALKEGIKCECVTSNVEFTSLALQSLNAMGCGDVKFKTYPSKNEGWSIYEAVV